MRKTNEYIVRKEWTTEQLAEALVQRTYQFHTEYDIEDKAYTDPEPVYYASDGKLFYDKDEAIRYEVWHLQQPAHIVNPEQNTFLFTTEEDWTPGENACWADCPFSFLIPLGETCRALKGEYPCPFINEKYTLL